MYSKEIAVVDKGVSNPTGNTDENCERGKICSKMNAGRCFEIGFHKSILKTGQKVYFNEQKIMRHSSKHLRKLYDLPFSILSMGCETT